CGLAGLAWLLPLSLHAGEPARKQAARKAPDEKLGYGAAFEEELKKVGQISPKEFAKRYGGKVEYLAKPSFDPTRAPFGYEFQKAPTLVRGKGTGYAFRLNADELTAFKQNGFVVSERMGAASFSEMLYRIYSRDLPVFVSTDALLHAWHRSYDAMLEELE